MVSKQHRAKQLARARAERRAARRAAARRRRRRRALVAAVVVTIVAVVAGSVFFARTASADDGASLGSTSGLDLLRTGVEPTGVETT